MKRFLSILCILSLLLGLLTGISFARPGDDDDDDGGSNTGDSNGVLEIVVPSGVSITMRNAWAGTGSTVSASSTSTSGSWKTYTYRGLATGSYSFTTSGSGYNSLTKDVYFVSGTTQTITKDPGKKMGNGWEQGSGIERTEQLISDGGLFASTTTSFPGYEYVFNTPVFTDGSIGKQQFTPHSTMISFVKAMVEDCSNAYYYNVGSSPSYGFEFPLVVFSKTDLTGKTMEEAGALIQANGKPTVFHQAQVHGNEPASGEGSLALIYAAATGKLTDYNGGDILDSVNIMVYPRINADGAYKYQRNNVKDGLNMNRGYLHARSSEIQDLLTVYNAFRPHICMDAHEWTPDNTGESNSYFDDLWLFCNGSTNNSASMLNDSIGIMENVFSDAEKLGIRPFFYVGNMNYDASEGTANSLAPYYYGLRGSYAFCVETRGIGIGRGCFERRVMSHYLTAESMIRYAAANAKAVLDKCNEERARIAAEGSVFSSKNTITLKHSNSTHSKAYPRPTLNLLTNTVTNPSASQKPAAAYTASRTRTRPTAYLLKAGTSGLSTVLTTLDRHGIPYIKLTESITLTVKSYSGTTKSASLSSAKEVTFDAGSYILPMNHMDGNILAMIMEPDVYDSSSSESYSTFVQRGILSTSSIYRFEGNIESLLEKPAAPEGLSVEQPTLITETGNIIGLDPNKVYEYRAEGSSSYIAVAEGSTEIPSLLPGVYYVRFAAVDGSQASDAVRLVINPQPELPKYTVIFYDADGKVLETQSVPQGSRVDYAGEKPTKAYTDDIHYVFEAWVDKNGEPAVLTNITSDREFYPTFSEGEHNYDRSTVKEPTCTEEGADLYTCGVCGRSYEETVEATGHSEELRDALAPTCSSVGYSGDLICTVCETVLEQGKTLPMTEHDEEILPGKEATCLGSGLTEGKICKVCGITTLAQTVLPRLGHSYLYTDNGDGTHTGTCERCDKVLTPAAHQMEDDTCIHCGYTLAGEPTVDSAVVIRHSLNLASDISVNYAVAADQLAGYNSFWLECVLPVYEGTVLTGEKSLRIEPVLTGNYYYFTLTGVTAVQMGDIIEATLHMEKDGSPYVSETDSYSVADYAYSQLNKASSTKGLKTLCADLLSYGTAAQIFKGYRTDAPVNGAMTAVQKSYCSNLDAITFGNNNSILDDIEIPDVTWAGKSLSLESKVILKFVIDVSAYAGDPQALTLRVSYKDHEGVDQVIVLSDPTVYGTATRYAFDFDGLLAAELRTVIDVAVFAGETQVSSTLRYSADTYGNNKTGDLLTLCKALFAYSDAAKDYFAN
ncbi:MAG: hypothetical protein II272_07515 [Oscillospiraceae bacterium]|nr:hypothetical protein [Oscillospiraceae bacterium]